MKDKIQKIREGIEKLKSNLVYGACSSQVAMETYDEVLAILDSMQEEPVSKQKLSNVQRNVKNWKEPTSWLDEFRAKLDSLSKEELVSEDLESEIQRYYVDWDEHPEYVQTARHFARWQKAKDQSTIELAEDHAMLAGMEKMKEQMMKNIWKPADGEDLPEIDREVIALLDRGKVVFAHRPPEYWDGKDIATGKVTRNYPKTYDKGGWNIPDVKYWLDVDLLNMEDSI